MIQPTVGRVVWYRTAYAGDPPLAAIVTYVHSDRMVNLVVFSENGVSLPKTSVKLLQDGDEVPAVGWPHAEWMTYQKGQAAKYDALAEKVGGAS